MFRTTPKDIVVLWHNNTVNALVNHSWSVKLQLIFLDPYEVQNHVTFQF